MSRYLLDTNIFVEAHRRHYPFDVFPILWERIIDISSRNLICSIDKVEREINTNQDELTQWCSLKLTPDFFKNSSVSIDTYMVIANWTYNHEQYTQEAKDEFLATDLADSWLVAYAKEKDLVIVTHEISQPQIKRKIKIPEVCEAFEVRYVNLIQMFREINEIF